MAIILVENLTKKFKDLVAVDGVSLGIEEGECFGLLGPNGAGKTTLIRVITGVSPATSGDVMVAGKRISTAAREVKAMLGVVPQGDNLDPDLTVMHNLMVFARYFEIPKEEAKRRADEVLAFFQLEEKRKAKIRELSGGMKRRLLIARGLINKPRIMVLDEPTTGLDPQARHLVWRELKDLKSKGVTQVLCTQNMEEAALLCDRVAIMHQGKILAVDSPARLISRYIGDRLWEFEAAAAEKEGLVAELKAKQAEYEVTDTVVKVFRLKDDSLATRLGRPRTPTLEDVFFRLTGGSLAQ